MLQLLNGSDPFYEIESSISLGELLKDFINRKVSLCLQMEIDEDETPEEERTADNPITLHGKIHREDYAVELVLTIDLTIGNVISTAKFDQHKEVEISGRIDLVR